MSAQLGERDGRQIASNVVPAWAVYLICRMSAFCSAHQSVGHRSNGRLRRVPAIVARARHRLELSPQQTLSLRPGNGSSCPYSVMAAPNGAVISSRDATVPEAEKSVGVDAQNRQDQSAAEILMRPATDLTLRGAASQIAMEEIKLSPIDKENAGR